jgi:hypothetical protein
MDFMQDVEIERRPQCGKDLLPYTFAGRSWQFIGGVIYSWDFSIRGSLCQLNRKCLSLTDIQKIQKTIVLILDNYSWDKEQRGAKGDDSVFDLVTVKQGSCPQVWCTSWEEWTASLIKILSGVRGFFVINHFLEYKMFRGSLNCAGFWGQRAQVI